VHDDAGVVVEAGDLRRLRLRQHAGGTDDEACGDGVAVGGLEAPDVLLVVEGRADDLGVQPGAAADVVLVHAVLGVRLELVAWRVHARPRGPLLEGELVAERGDVDRDARVRVPVPRPADSVALLEHQVVAEAGPVEPDGRADAGEPTTDDDHLVVVRDSHGVTVLAHCAESERRTHPALWRVE
jgi:hypothetical protein